ncbi:MAG: S24 family peptidase [Carboxylicivirga sp.]|jgi:phage repressor protein C with HTH and peptisase S24 domain|nr:S24 family peptidase [Carboxylicivirga sp.]
MKAIERFYLYIEHKGIRPTRFEKEFGLSNGYLGTQLKRKGSLGEDVLNKIIDNCRDINSSWLLTGEGEMLKEDTICNCPSKHESEPDKTYLAGYYYPNVNASASLNFGTNNGEQEKIPVNIPNFGDNLEFINVFGDSMYPKFQSGEIIGIKEIEYTFLTYGNTYVVVMINGDTHLKYVKKGKDEDHVLLVSENKFYDDREFHIKNISKFFQVRGVISRLAM